MPSALLETKVNLLLQAGDRHWKGQTVAFQPGWVCLLTLGARQTEAGIEPLTSLL